MRTFVVTTEGQNRLGPRELCERYVNDQWFAARGSDELAAEALLDQFIESCAANQLLILPGGGRT